ncbi:hypothetical protein RHMOL_Rhmol05G0065600 [Rhododendron molle]|uniref:Uncharacterized protein n=1 Tax=Rhododendron molle TaxID=49168 RepID=A0ACC0NL83_RHOML|nr:hypothetical protein RHMOL_Rhmol05G0065600 [Rhododendron molle]
MAKEQVDRVEPPPPPSVGNDSNKFGGFAENLVCLAFWIERGAAASIVLSFYWFPPNVWGSIFFIFVSLLILSNSLYLIALLSSLLQIWEPCRWRDFNDTYPIAVAVFGATLLQAEDGRNNKIDKENTGQQEAKLNFSSKESKEEVQAKDEMNYKIDEEFTGQQKAKHEASLKESKGELRSSSCCTSEQFQSSEAKYHAKYENLLRKYFDKCHVWEEERSQLMKELGSAKASSEIYRELLHGSDDF